MTFFLLPGPRGSGFHWNAQPRKDTHGVRVRPAVPDGGGRSGRSVGDGAFRAAPRIGRSPGSDPLAGCACLLGRPGSADLVSVPALRRVSSWPIWFGRSDRADQGIESIIGTDERVRVKNTLAFPGSATVLIRQFGRLHCTGWMVSKDTLMTAGHCVRDGGSDGEWTAGLTFVPGSNGGDAPFGVCRSRRTTRSPAGTPTETGSTTARSSSWTAPSATPSDGSACGCRPAT